MHEHKDEYTIARMAKALNVSESGYYKWVKQAFAPPTEKELEDIALAIEISDIFRRSRGSYGSRKITVLINAGRSKEGKRSINHKRIERLMREYSMFSKTSKKYRCTTDSRHDDPIAENLLGRDFHAGRPNEKMVSDTTVIDTEEGDLYAAGIIDLYGRMPVGFAFSNKNDRFLTMEALEDMLKRGYGSKGCIMHSDRGSTYTSGDYRDALEKNDLICSMSGKGDCWDNSPMESFWGKMKSEWLAAKYKTRLEAIRDILEYVWVFYPNERPHASNGYMTPADYYKQYTA